MRDNKNQIIHVCLYWKPDNKNEKLIFPSWTPGSYTIRDHVQYLNSIKLEQESKELFLDRVSINSWDVNLSSLSELKLTYTIEAKLQTVRTSYLDNEYASLCLSSVVMLINSHRDNIHTLSILQPKGWTNYIPLPRNKLIEAQNYDQLVDSPLHSGIFKSINFKVANNNHELLLIGQPPNGWPISLVKHISLVCESACELMGETSPAKNNYQLIIILSDSGYGGLEHNNSSVLQFNWNLLQEENGYRILLQLVGHEYLHLWNIRRLRPKEYTRYDYSNAKLSENLWFAEGITSYYDLFLPLKAGLSTKVDLLEDLSREINLYLNSPGRHIQSLAQSSKEAWVKLYKSNPDSVNSQVSYYRLGTLISFVIDIHLRIAGSSLLVLLRSMWNKYAYNKNGYFREDIKTELKLLSPEISKNLNQWLDECDSIPLEKSLKLCGLNLIQKSTDEPDIGISLKENNGKLNVMSVIVNSVTAKSGIVTGDEIIAVDQYRVNTKKQFLSIIALDKTYNITIVRNGMLKVLQIEFIKEIKYQYNLIIDENIDIKTTKLREDWFNLKA